MGDNTTHAALSPSARHRWGACPGSIREGAKYPEPPSGPAALDGTRSHALLEHCINNGLSDPRLHIGTTFEYDYEGVKDSFPVDQARADRVNVAVEYIKSRVGYHAPIAERRVFPDGLVGRADMHGTVDCQIPDKAVYEIIDFKDGMAPVDAKDNPQLEVYGLGVLAGLPTEEYPKVIRFTIVQPKLAMRGMPVISSHDIKTKDLLAKVPAIIAEAAATDDPNAPLVPGESQCKYCRAKGACSALAGKAMQEVGLMFAPVPSPNILTQTYTVEVPPFLGDSYDAACDFLDPGNQTSVEVLDPAIQAAQQDPSVMSDAQLRQLLEAAPLVRQMLEGAEAEVRRRLESGKPVPGFKLVNGRGSRKWALGEDEMAKKLAGMGVPKSAMYITTLVSPAQAEKLVWDKKGEPQRLSEIQLKRMATEYIATTMGKPSVVPESDPRPAVITDASPMFQAVETPAFLAQPAEATVAPAENPVPDWLAVPAWLK